MVGVKRAKVFVSIILLIAIFAALHHFSKIYFFERDERILCEQFLLNNKKVLKLTGQIKEVDVSWKGTYVEGYGDEISGRYCFIIDGVIEKKKFFIDWQTIKGEFSVIAISLVEGISNKEKWRIKIQEDRARS